MLFLFSSITLDNDAAENKTKSNPNPHPHPPARYAIAQTDERGSEGKIRARWSMYMNKNDIAE